MTRINTIDPVLLPTPWLVAEYRELPRIINRVADGVPTAGPFPGPYRMGRGHVSFFFNKLHWLYQRHHQLVQEMERRGFKPNMTMHVAMDKCLKLRPDLCVPNIWQPDPADHAVCLGRLADRWKGTLLEWNAFFRSVTARHGLTAAQFVEAYANRTKTGA